MRTDTIVAPATPAGIAGLAVIRISGTDTFKLLSCIITGRKLTTQPTHTAQLYWLKDKNGKPIDQTMITVFRRPRSYTGEDMAEIACHGSPLIVDKIVQLCRQHGARLAEPGEFTKRAVLNGKLSLTQAEAVQVLVTIQAPRAHQLAIAAYQGATAKVIARFTEQLRNLYAEIEYLLGLDEDPQPNVAHLDRATNSVLTQLNRLITQAEKTSFLFTPAKVAIVGRANVGKSSLFNRLLAEKRAITSPIPGTTRDRIESALSLDGIKINLIDTCGFDPASRNPLTRIGTQQTHHALGQADLLLVVFDNSQPVHQLDRAIIAECEKKPKIYIINKCDLKTHFNYRSLLNQRPLAISCKTGSNIARLRQLLRAYFRQTNSRCPVTTQRQLQALQQARARLIASLNALDLTIRATELRSALTALEEIDAPTTTEEILNRIFSQFCVGK